MRRLTWTAGGAALLVGAMALGGCGGGNAERRQDLLRRASFDFQCPENQLKITTLQETGDFESVETSNAVEGCGKRGVYVLQNNKTWVADPSATTPASPPPAAGADRPAPPGAVSGGEGK